MRQTADGGRTRNLDSKVQTQVQAQQSARPEIKEAIGLVVDTIRDSLVGMAHLVNDSGEKPEMYFGLVRTVAGVIQAWAFWRWLGRRSRLVPWEAYQSLTVSMDGWIKDVGVCAIAAAYQKVEDDGERMPGITRTEDSWRRFVEYVLCECKTRNVLKGEGGR